MGIVPKNIETVEWPKIRRASSKNNTQRAAYKAVNKANRTMLNSQSLRRARKPGLATGNCASANASTPVPMVAANQFGVNWRITSRGCCRWLNGLIPGLMVLGHVMVNSCPRVRLKSMVDPDRISI
jgi:hypothetical protein